MICLVLRDDKWLTIKPEISGEQVITRTGSFIIKYTYTFLRGDIHYTARVIIEGGEDNTVSFRFRGEARSSFMKNRIGICVLHPIHGLAGKDCIVENPEGELLLGKFPDQISPHQPFTDITLMQWNINGSSCRLDFYGDVFETEDQRNWTDASYKTYAPPLRFPYPLEVTKGETQYQKSVLRVVTEDGGKGSPESETNEIRIFPSIKMPLPRIGICRSTRREPLTHNEASILRHAGFDNYRFDILLFNDDWKVNAEASMNEAEAAGCKAEIALFFGNSHLLQAGNFTEWAFDHLSTIEVVHLLHRDHHHTPENIIQELTPIIRKALPDTLISAGTNANFAQLNRNRPVPGEYDLITWSAHPQEHASDNMTLAENLEGQAYAVETARTFSYGKELWVGPVTLQRRFNANNEKYSVNPGADSRMPSLFGACWTAGSIKHLGQSGVKGITYYEAAGERGIFQGDFLPSSGDFQTFEGMIYPVYHIFRFINSHKSSRIIKSISESPEETDALVLSDGRKFRLILVNYTGRPRTIRLEGIRLTLTVRHLDESTFERAVSEHDWLEKTRGRKMSGSKIRLMPYSIILAIGTRECKPGNKPL